MTDRIRKLLYIALISCVMVLGNISFLFAAEAVLSWNPPTTNEDGSPLTDLAGFKIYHGTESGNYSQSINAGNVTTYRIAELTVGQTYYFSVTAYDTSDNESIYSSEVNTTIESSGTIPEQFSTGDIDGNGQDDIIIDFGPGLGTWVRGNSSTWTKLHDLSPEIIATGDMDGNGQDEVVIDFGNPYGLWVRYNDTLWEKLHDLSPEIIATGDMDGNGQDEVIIDFGPSYGVWVRYNNAIWTWLHSNSPESMVTGDLDGNGQDEVIIDFGFAYGLWVHYNVATVWIWLHSNSPESMVTGDLDGSGQDEVVIDFGTSHGLWVRNNNATWAEINNNNL